MIIWSIDVPTTQALEVFLYAFRDLKFLDSLLGDCDIALVPTSEGPLHLIVPRSPGTFEVLMEVWHLSVKPYYPFTDVLVSETGITGITDPSPDPLRCRVKGNQVESITVYSLSYETFLGYLRSRPVLDQAPLNPWFVSQPDGTKRFKFEPPGPGSKHLPLSLEQDYHPQEYAL